MPATTTPRETTLDWHRQYPSQPRSVRQARHDTDDTLRSWGTPNDVIDTAALITSELTSNAIAHGHRPGRTFELRLRLDGHTLTIDVSDATAEFPTPAKTSNDAEHGRGLTLVAALTGSPVEAHPRRPVGKTVRARLNLTG